MQKTAVGDNSFSDLIMMFFTIFLIENDAHSGAVIISNCFFFLLKRGLF